jgi:hypothetical protein
LLLKTFFSTDVVKYQNQNGGKSGNGTFSRIAMDRWLEVTLPLTALTLLIAWGTYKYTESGRWFFPRKLHMLDWSLWKIWKPKSLSLPLHNKPEAVS